MKSQKQNNVTIYNHPYYYKVISDQSCSLFIFPHQLKCVLVNLFQSDAGLAVWRLRCTAKWLEKKSDSTLAQQRGWGWSGHAEH